MNPTSTTNATRAVWRRRSTHPWAAVATAPVTEM
jgi:hypothetical protein